MGVNRELRDEELAIDSRQQLVGFLIGIILTAMIVAAGYILWQLAPSESDGPISLGKVSLLWASLGGFLGGAGRSLRMLIREWGGHAGKPPSVFFDKWFLYFFKPLVGVLGGFSFFLVLNLGLVKLFADTELQFGFARVMLSSVTDGLFFEDVFDLLRGLIPKAPRDEREKGRTSSDK